MLQYFRLENFLLAPYTFGQNIAVIEMISASKPHFTKTVGNQIDFFVFQ